MLQKYQTWAAKQGGELLSSSAKRGMLEWRCKYGHVFERTGNQVKRGKWCPICGTKGERAVGDLLRSWNLAWIKEYKLSVSKDHPLYNKRYDFYFYYHSHWLIEFDGIHHFQYKAKFHRGKGGLTLQHQTDRDKTWLAYQLGYRVIRIDYTQLDFVGYHIYQALTQNSAIYVSTPRLYLFLTA